MKGKESSNIDSGKGQNSELDTLTLTQMMRASKGDDFLADSSEAKVGLIGKVDNFNFFFFPLIF